MSIFGGKPTLEARLSSLVAVLTSAFNLSDEQSAAIAGGDHTVIESALAGGQAVHDAAMLDAQAANARLTSELSASNERATGFETELGAANTAATNLATALRDSLQLSPEQVTALTGGDLTIVAAAVTQLAQRKAVEIAAGQGVPPVVTDPTSASSEEDEIALARQAAHEERDPFKRAALHQRASNLVTQKKSKARN